ncbi:GTP-binding protein-like protein [Tupanvirus soda lake]|uniref:GTP-binding protein-like protein n=2 Tax=Tupanvirus TaxID=2094720 RepID=A0A6N1NSM8_9VIRU|nr:GTP-binding protein-like protein [Tupanvirus soda lake]QKU34688.1 GTP-binding protein-like protein [Tupanvirus soda lake]
MNVDSTMINRIKNLNPKLFVTEIVDNNMTFTPEQDDGHIEYKRTLADCSNKKAEKYATQMRWRITENVRNQCATYFIGVDDDGTVVGLTEDEIIDCVKRFIDIASTISASITGIQLIHINSMLIIKIGVKIKKIYDNYLVEFGEKF